MNNSVIRKITKLPVNRHITIQRDTMQYLPLFISSGVPASRSKNLDPVLARLLDRLQGAGWDGAGFRAG